MVLDCWITSFFRLDFRSSILHLRFPIIRLHSGSQRKHSLFCCQEQRIAAAASDELYLFVELAVVGFEGHGQFAVVFEDLSLRDLRKFFGALLGNRFRFFSYDHRRWRWRQRFPFQHQLDKALRDLRNIIRASFRQRQPGYDQRQQEYDRQRVSHCTTEAGFLLRIRRPLQIVDSVIGIQNPSPNLPWRRLPALPATAARPPEKFAHSLTGCRSPSLS